MIIHSIVSEADIFFNSGELPRNAEYKAIKGGLLELSGGEVTRLISTDPALYLKKEYFPSAHYNG